MSMYQFLPEVILRSPALSYHEYAAPQIKALLQMPFFRNAIFLASSSFYLQLKKKAFDYDALDQKAILTLNKYANRMCFRPTPFGLFSAFSVVEWGDDRQIELGGFKPHLKISFEENIKASVQINEARHNNDVLIANKTIYKVGKDYRYLVSKPNDEIKSYQFLLNSISASGFITRLLKHTAKKRYRAELIDFIALAAEVDTGQASNLLDELIGLQIVVNANLVNITGTDFLDRLKSKQTVINPFADYSPAELSKLTSQISGEKNVYLEDTLNPKDNYYVNLERNIIGGSLNKAYQQNITDAIACLQQLTANYDQRNKMENFVSAFNKKFEGQILPLLYALDPETGVSYENLASVDDDKTLTNDITWEAESNKASIVWSEIHSLFLKKGKLGTSEACTIYIDDDDLAAIKTEKHAATRPATISVVFRIVDDKVFIEHAGGITANSLIGRFTLFNEQINKMALAVAGHEQQNNPDVIFAEIAHICEYHTANINRRYNPYQYEIPVLTSSIAADEAQLPLSDLWVSVNNGEVVLLSKRTKKRVIPRLSSAFNHSRSSLSVFRFLCDLQSFGLNGHWGLNLSHFFPNLEHYPRVEYKGSILCLASWHIKKKQLESIQNKQPAERVALFDVFKKSINLTDNIALTVGDNQLIFNLKISDDVLFFLDTVKSTDQVNIVEFLPIQPGKEIVTDDSQKPFINQFVASLYHTQPVYQGINGQLAITRKQKRLLPPGSEWLYFKIYCHSVRSNEIITDKLYPLLKKMAASGIISQWFFIRYVDPGYHIRLRVKHGTNQSYNSYKQITTVLNRLIKNESISNYQIAVYERELERYSVALIDTFETVFHQSSVLIAAYLNILKQENNQCNLDAFSFITISNILSAFDIYGADRLAFLTSVYDSFYLEFKAEAQMKYELDTKFRHFRPKIEAAFLNEAVWFNDMELQTENKAFINSVSALNNQIAGKPAAIKLKWAADVIHMHFNRLFVDDERRNEFVIYFLLMRYEKSAMVKNASTGKAGAVEAAIVA